MLYLQYVYICIYCCEFWPVRRAIGRVTRIAAASPTGTNNSVVTLLGLPPEPSHGWGFDPTAAQSADYPCGIGSIAQSRYTNYTRTGILPRGSTAPRPTPDTNRLSGSFRITGITERSYRRPGRFRSIIRVLETRYEPLT